MRNEYTRTRNKDIGKARFPSLLNELWQTEAVKTRNNIVKSFMTAGVFPLNPNSINSSRILGNNLYTTTSRSVTINTNNNQTNNSSSVTSFANLNTNLNQINNNQANNSQTNNNQTNNNQINLSSSATSLANVNTNHNQINNNQTNNLSSSTSSSLQTTFSFYSSRDAISALDQVLGDTMLNYDNEDDDDDEDYVPNKSARTSSSALSNGQRQSLEETSVITKDHQPILPRRNSKRKKRSSNIIGIDTSDEEGNFDSYTLFIVKTNFSYR